MTKRIFWIDAIRAISIIFVLVNHSTGNVIWLERFYVPFFLTSFFFVSGYVFTNPERPFEWKQKAIRIIESIMVPYLTYWVISYFILDVFVKQIGIMGYWDHLLWSFQDGNRLWFISCLLLIEMIMLLLFAFFKRLRCKLLISSIILFVYFVSPFSHTPYFPWSLNVALFMQVFFMLGHLYRIFENTIDTINSQYRIFLIFFIAYIGLYAYDAIIFNSHNSVASNQYSSYTMFILMALIGIVVLVYGLKKIKSNSVMTYLGTNTLLIYFFHKQLIDFAKYLTPQLYIEVPSLLSGVFQVLLVLVTVTIPIYICNRFLPFMSGKSRWLSERIFR